ncbi:MAG: metallophosphoesterase [Clostridiales bacterium]|nr:metallophosphoesterase [Clostridiales bacterium]
MAVYGIADLHLAKDIDKPMDVFSSYWDHYMERISENWKAKVCPEDTVLIPGDVSWATYLDEIDKDFSYIEDLPGKKIISRGNHDYWWTTIKKMEKFTADHGFDSITFLQNRTMQVEDMIVGATRGWLLPGDREFTDGDMKIYEREIIRLGLCIRDMEERDPGHKMKRVIMIHYPPISPTNGNNGFTGKLLEGEVDLCLYGHLHGKGHKVAREGVVNGTLYRCISSDFLGFDPLLISDLTDR